jgi:transposase
MKRFIQGEHRGQSTLLPESLDDYVSDTNPVRMVDVFVDELDLAKLGFDGVIPAETGRPAYHPAILLKIYIYGYLNRIQSSRRLEREAQRNVELMWLTGRLMPDFKTIANFRKDNSKAIRGVCRQFVLLCQQLGLFSENLVAIDGSKFKEVKPASVDSRSSDDYARKCPPWHDALWCTFPRLPFGLDNRNRSFGPSPALQAALTRNTSASGHQPPCLLPIGQDLPVDARLFFYEFIRPHQQLVFKLQTANIELERFELPLQLLSFQ